MDGEELGLIDGTGTEEVELGGTETFTEEPADTDDAATEEGAQEERETEGEEAEGAARRVNRADLPLQLRKALRTNPEIAKQFPQLEKQITGALFKANLADKLGGVQKFREFAETMEAHGGPEGIAAMNEELGTWRALDQGFERGDPKILDGWVKDYPTGFKALIGPAIDKLEAMDQTAFDQTLSSPMWKTLDRCGVISTLQNLEAALTGNRIEDAQAQYKLLKGFFSDLRSLAVKSKSPDPLAGDRQRLDEERTGLQEKEQKMFYGSVRQDVNGQIIQETNRLIRQELGGTKIKLSVANRLRKEINEELVAAVNGKKSYQEDYKAVMASGDRERAIRFIVSNAKAKLPSVVKQLVADFNIKRTSSASTSGGRRENGVSGRPGGEGSRVVAGRPKTSDVDFTRTDKSTWLTTMNGHGQAYLRNGKLAKW